MLLTKDYQTFLTCLLIWEIYSSFLKVKVIILPVLDQFFKGGGGTGMRLSSSVEFICWELNIFQLYKKIKIKIVREYFQEHFTNVF